jgi:cell division protein FtsZ
MISKPKEVMQEDLINEINVPKTDNSIIMVIGVGGAGGNALNYMWKMGIHNVEFLACNTDKRALDRLSIPEDCKLVLGEGLGAGNDPKRGRELAIGSLEEIKQRLEAKKIKMVFITAGMGGGTGTGASPVIAKLTQEMGLLTIANVTYPLRNEGPIRLTQATQGIEELRQYADSLIIVNNDSIFDLYGKLPFREAFNKADDILASATKGISEIITVNNAYIVVDFADLKRVMKGSGRAHMGVGVARGAERAKEAARNSLCSPLLDNNSIAGSKYILINIAANDIDTITYEETIDVQNYIQSYASYKNDDGEVCQANLIWGVSSKPMADDELEVVVVATGFSDGDDINSLIQPMVDIEPVTDFFDAEPAKPVVEEAPKVIEEPRHAEKDQRRVPNAPAVLERTVGRYKEIEVNSKTPTYTRKGVQMIVEKTSHSRSKEVMSVGSKQQQAESGDLFNPIK